MGLGHQKVIPDHEKVIPDHFLSTGGRRKPAEIGKKSPNSAFWITERAVSCTLVRTEWAWDHEKVIRDLRKVILKPSLSLRFRIPMRKGARKVTGPRFASPQRVMIPFAVRKEMIRDGKKVICGH